MNIYDTTLAKLAAQDIMDFDTYGPIPDAPIRRLLLFLHNRARVATRQGFTSSADDLRQQREAVLQGAVESHLQNQLLEKYHGIISELTGEYLTNSQKASTIARAVESLKEFPL